MARPSDLSLAHPTAAHETTIWNLRQLHLFTSLRPREIRALSNVLHEAAYRRGRSSFTWATRRIACTSCARGS